MLRRSCRGRISRAARVLAGAAVLLGVARAPVPAEVGVAPGLRVEPVVTGIPRPLQLAFGPAERLLVLSHGLGGDAAEIYRLDLAGTLPLDASRAPKLVIPYAAGPRKTTLGSLAVDPRTGDLFVGEENGNRIYRLTAAGKLVPFATGLHYLVGGTSLAFDGAGRLVVVDYAGPEGQFRPESPPPPGLDWLMAEAYQGPLVFRLDPRADLPLPRRLELSPPLFPKAAARRPAGDPLPRLVSVAIAPDGDPRLLGSLGELFRLTSESVLERLARLPAGHYHRTNIAVAPDGSVLVAGGFHIRRLFWISGVVSVVAWDLGDPGGVVVDRAGQVYVAETALHRIIRIRPVP